MNNSLNLNLVSVLMTAYNRELYIAEAIESIVNQTYQNWELIIVDDGSKDKTVEIAKAYEHKDARIKVYINEQNLGDYPNRNKAASYASGELLMYVDSDDTIAQNALEYVVEQFNQFPTVQHSTIYYEQDLIIPTVLASETAIKNHLYKNNMLATGPGARVFIANFLREIGGYPTKYGPANDMYFNLLSTSKSDILVLPYQYLSYREHEAQENKNKLAYLHNGYRYFNDIMQLPFLPLTLSERRKLINKNKRRFLVNSLKYFTKTKDINGILCAIKLSNFKFKDFIIGLFHF